MQQLTIEDNLYNSMTSILTSILLEEKTFKKKAIGFKSKIFDFGDYRGEVKYSRNSYISVELYREDAQGRYQRTQLRNECQDSNFQMILDMLSKLDRKINNGEGVISFTKIRNFISSNYIKGSNNVS